jgi:hypothetical protein
MLRIACLAALLALAAPAAAQTPNYFESGTFWLTKCRSRGSELSECIGFLYGFHSASVANPSRVYCQPVFASYGQMLEVVLSWAARNPHATHHPFGHIVIWAMAEAFPCR